MIKACLVTCLGLAAVGADGDRPCVVVVVGAAGQAEYAPRFRKWADQWQAAAQKAMAESIRIGGLDDPGATADRDRLKEVLAGKTAPSRAPLWIVLIGHGTYDGREARFNLRGPDFTEVELADWLAPINRPVAVLDCTSASSPFLNRLSGEGRVIVTATRSGSEQNYARFGEYLAGALTDPAADLDKDGQVSLLEMFLTAGNRTAEYYRSHAQLATEHPLIDDNGDRQGTPADWFHGVRATKRAKAGAALDGLRAHQLHLIPSDREKALPAELRARRDELELAIAALRDEKGQLGEDDYYDRLEPLMVELARLYRKADPAPAASRTADEGRPHP